jgi:hypothetical protein
MLYLFVFPFFVPAQAPSAKYIPKKRTHQIIGIFFTLNVVNCLLYKQLTSGNKK